MLERMKDLIRSQDICVLATACGNRPHCSLMAYVTDKDCREIYMVTHRNTVKFRNATENPSVSLLIDTRAEDRKDRQELARALTVTGLFERIDEPERLEAIRARLLARHAYLRDFAAHSEAEVFAVKIQSFLLLDGITESYYERIA